MRCWEALADGVLDAAVLIRLEGTQRAAEQRVEAWVARQQRKIDEGLIAMSQVWAASRGARAITTRSRTSPWVARWAISTSVSRS